MTNNYEIIDGIKCYSPDNAFNNDGFNIESFGNLFRLEERNFWFRARNRILQMLVKKNLNEDKKTTYLEIGCGTGYVLSGLNKLNNLTLIGSEIYIEGLKYAKKRLPEVDFIQLDAANIPFNNELDAIGAFDVLEHITEDELVMENVFKALKKDGLFFITVPQYMFMWSSADEIACHKRRYSKKEIINKLEKAGFSIKFLSSFVFSLFPLMVISRFIKGKDKSNQKTGSKEYNELNLNPIINKIFEYILYIDVFLIRIGIKLPFGGSLVVIGKK